MLHDPFPILKSQFVSPSFHSNTTNSKDGISIRPPFCAQCASHAPRRCECRTRETRTPQDSGGLCGTHCESFCVEVIFQILGFSVLIEWLSVLVCITQREKLIQNHKRRREQLQKLLQEAKTQVDDHRSGRRLMEQEEYEKINKRVGLYEQKLLRMPEEPDESVR